MESLSSFLSPITVPISHLFLDPNNPRFVGSDWIYVPDASATSQYEQDRAAQRLLTYHDVKKLQLVIETNGYLPIDRVVVRRISDTQFIVLEGNRRICAAKQINGYSDDGSVLPQDILNTLKEIPCLEYTGTDGATEAAWIFQGLRHISGISEWPAFNKAKLLVDEMKKSRLSFTDVGKRFGLSAFGAAQWVRGYYAFSQAKEETEFSKYIDERIYPYFQELFGRSSIPLKEWLGWNEDHRKFNNQANLNEFVGWFFPPDSEATEDEETFREPTDAELADAWRRRRINKRDDLRQLSYLITKAHKEWMDFRHGGDLEKAYSRAILSEIEKSLESEEDTAEKLFKYVDESIKLLENTPFSILSSSEMRSNLFLKIEKIIKIYGGLKHLTGG